jgi:hypothetical protein
VVVVVAAVADVAEEDVKTGFVVWGLLSVLLLFISNRWLITLASGLVFWRFLALFVILYMRTNFDIKR